MDQRASDNKHEITIMKNKVLLANNPQFIASIADRTRNMIYCPCICDFDRDLQLSHWAVPTRIILLWVAWEVGRQKPQMCVPIHQSSLEGLGEWVEGKEVRENIVLMRKFRLPRILELWATLGGNFLVVANQQFTMLMLFCSHNCVT